MGKYSKDLDESLSKEVKAIANEIGLQIYGIEIETVRLKNKKNSPYGEVLRSSDLVKLFTEKENLLVIAINEEVMEQFDTETRRILIENLLEQISAEENKDGELKITLKKNEISAGLGTYHKYKGVLIEKLELVHLTQQQIQDQKEMDKAMAKAAKAGK